MADPEAILDALAAGLSVEKAAKRFKLPIVEVRNILRDEVDRCRDGEHVREVWALADRRLAAVELKFYNKAVEGDCDPQSAIVFVKTSERRATLAGANAPIGHAVTVMTAAAPAHLNSTQKLQAAVDRIRGVTVRERELDDKQSYDEPLTSDERAELDQLRAAREAKRAQQDRDTGAAQYSIGDAACPGLCIRITPKGIKSFAYAYRNKGTGKVEWLTLGRYPDVPLSRAREIANDARKTIAGGATPMTPKVQRAEAEKKLRPTPN
jgi:hypothetical protein